jgi:mono/diheme cytochrome c family protein
MLKLVKLLVLLLFFGFLPACGPARHSGAGFRLPPTGDPARGKVLFVSLGCNGCHEVAGSDLPRPTVQPPVPVVLGGTVDYQIPDGFLVTSIINPSYDLAAYPSSQITIAGHSRMPSYADRLTVSQLTDLVAYLQTQYRLRQFIPQPVF